MRRIQPLRQNAGDIFHSHRMNWYYAANGEHRGPFSEEEVRRMAGLGALSPATLVWHEGMPEWTPYGVAVTPQGKVDAQPGTTVACVECGRSFAPDDLVTLGGVPVCAACKPRLLQRLTEGAPLPRAGAADGVWRDGNVLVVRRGASLPPCCVRCGAASTVAPLVRLSWNPPWIYLAIPPCALSLFFPVVPFYVTVPAVLVALLVFNRRAKLNLPLCGRHRQQQWLGRVAGTGLAIAGLIILARQVYTLGMFGVLGVFTLQAEPLIGLLLLLAGLTLQSQANWVLSPQRIDKAFIRLKRGGSEFLATLPPFKGR